MDNELCGHVLCARVNKAYEGLFAVRQVTQFSNKLRGSVRDSGSECSS